MNIVHSIQLITIMEHNHQRLTMLRMSPHPMIFLRIAPTVSRNPATNVVPEPNTSSPMRAAMKIPNAPPTKPSAYANISQRAATEADRVRRYVADHKMGQYQLDSKTSSKLNLMVACFWYRWYELDMVDEEPQGAAIYRFFTNQCGLECSVMPKAFATVICKIINSGKKDPEIYDNLYSYFPELNKNNRN